LDCAAAAERLGAQIPPEALSRCRYGPVGLLYGFAVA
jgi:hypothetical protein